MDRVEKINLEQIEMLNQRGGRTLSVVDLMRAGTLPVDMAAWCFCAVRSGSSFLTAANPGGAGKTTLMAALLAFLPPGEKLRTVGLHASRVPRGHSDHGRECLLGHEVGRGAYFGYLWGREACAFFNAPSRGVRIATNLHADTMDEVRQTVQGPEIGLGDEHFHNIGFVAFMACRQRAGKSIRRVASLHAAVRGAHERLWEWDEPDDRYFWRAAVAPEETLPQGQAEHYAETVKFMGKLRQENAPDYRSTRETVLKFIEATA